MNTTTYNGHLLAADLSDASHSQGETPNRLTNSTMDATDRHPVISQLESLARDWTALPPDVALAVGVLRQATRDLHTFRSAERGIERQIYCDAFAWICDEDYSWPYSFVNVCATLQVPSATMRAEIITDAPLAWSASWRRAAGRRVRSLCAAFGDSFRPARAV